MGIKTLKDGRVKVMHHYRRPDGSKTSTSKVLPAHADQRLILRTKLELMESVEGEDSLTVPCYQHISEAYRRARGDGGDPWRFNALEGALGKRLVDRRFAYHYSRHIDSLSDLSENSKANHKSIVQRVLNWAYREQIIEETTCFLHLWSKYTIPIARMRRFCPICGTCVEPGGTPGPVPVVGAGPFI